jgi:hypothetical protein
MSDEAGVSIQVGSQTRAWEPALASFKGNSQTCSKRIPKPLWKSSHFESEKTEMALLNFPLNYDQKSDRLLTLDPFDSDINELNVNA